MQATRNTFRKYGAKIAAVGTAGLLTANAAMAQATGAAASLGELKDSMGDYATPLFALAVVAAGIMIGIKYIKRGARAA